MLKRVKPKSGQESVWDYPRPPRVEESTKRVKILHAGVVIADTTRAKRVLETSHPPVYYLPQEDILMKYLNLEARQTWCEFKGAASYWTLIVNGTTITSIAWSYVKPSSDFKDIKDHLAFYPGKLDACFVNDEQVQAQEGDFYGGWITNDIVGPFKGGVGTWGW